VANDVPGGRTPRVSVGLPVFNGENFLHEALESICSQTFTDLEVIISDNGSTDATAAIGQEFARRDPRVRYHRSDENLGGTWNFNRVLQLARGEYFRWAAHDDVVAPRYLERCVEALDARPDAVLCHTAVEIIDGDGVNAGRYESPPWRRGADRVHVRFHDAVLYKGRLHLIFGLMRRAALERVPAYGAYSHADGVLLARLVMLGPFLHVDEPLQLMREHPDQISTTCGVKSATGMVDYLAWRSWYDPKYADRVGFPYWRILGEYARSLAVVPDVAMNDRIRCVGGVCASAWSSKGQLRRDLARAALFVMRDRTGDAQSVGAGSPKARRTTSAT
jgi:glycosyltransferase involved in cell wall biosynthesis